MMTWRGGVEDHQVTLSTVDRHVDDVDERRRAAVGPVAAGQRVNDRRPRRQINRLRDLTATKPRSLYATVIITAASC